MFHELIFTIRQERENPVFVCRPASSLILRLKSFHPKGGYLLSGGLTRLWHGPWLCRDIPTLSSPRKHGVGLQCRNRCLRRNIREPTSSPRLDNITVPRCDIKQISFQYCIL
jgi:hypothetical protein